MPRETPFKRLLIANRGEIACRIIAAARALGIHTIAVYSDADRHARHVKLANEAYRLGSDSPAQSYLNLDALMTLAERAHAQAIHPGYGFLSEDPRLAQACAQAGIVFVGPSAQAMQALGNKAAAKRVAANANVPVLGTSSADKTPAQTATEIGYPVLVKAAAGGGGRGMRRVNSADEFNDAYDAARAEALVGFGSDELLIEPWIDQARHIEIQILADQHGNIVHLGERDCSTQRRHQKIIEEAPAAGMDPDIRAAMGEAAVNLARQVGYVGAGTVEFLLRGDNSFYFLEMNTRLQVEHPVTEAITGVDLVQWQLRIAAGEAIDFRQSDVYTSGHAIEARLCAEDAGCAFRPLSGPIARWRFPDPAMARTDHGLAEYAEVSPFYDSMVAKLIASGPTREIARARLISALEHTVFHGPLSNRTALIQCLEDQAFRDATITTSWLDHVADDHFVRSTPQLAWACAAALWVDLNGLHHGPLAGLSSPLGTGSRIVLEHSNEHKTVAVHFSTDQPDQTSLQCHARVDVDADTFELRWSPNDERITVDDQQYRFSFTRHGNDLWLSFEQQDFRFTCRHDVRRTSALAASSGTITAPMHARIASLDVTVGEHVQAGQLLLTLESMKIAHRIEAPMAGRVSECIAAMDQQVSPGKLLMRLVPLDTSNDASR